MCCLPATGAPGEAAVAARDSVGSLLLTRRPDLAMWERSKIPQGAAESAVRDAAVTVTYTAHPAADKPEGGAKDDKNFLSPSS